MDVLCRGLWELAPSNQYVAEYFRLYGLGMVG